MRLFSDLRFLFADGGVAQLGERLLCKQEVIGSIPFTSTILLVLGAQNTSKQKKQFFCRLTCVRYKNVL